MLKKILHWAPRILSLMFVGFLCLFSLDGFSEYNGLSTLLAVFMHLLIPLIVLIAVIISWKKDLVGTIIFLFSAIYYVWMAGLGRHWSWYVAISGPALFIAILYLLNWFQKRKTN